MKQSGLQQLSGSRTWRETGKSDKVVPDKVCLTPDLQKKVTVHIRVHVRVNILKLQFVRETFSSNRAEAHMKGKFSHETLLKVCQSSWHSDGRHLSIEMELTLRIDLVSILEHLPFGRCLSMDSVHNLIDHRSRLRRMAMKRKEQFELRWWKSSQLKRKTVQCKVEQPFLLRYTEAQSLFNSNNRWNSRNYSMLEIISYVS